MPFALVRQLGVSMQQSTMLCWSPLMQIHSVSTIAAAQRRLLQHLRRSLDTASSSTAKICLLRAAARLYSGVAGGENEVLPLVMLIGHLTTQDPQVAATAVDLLQSLATASNKSLEQLLLQGPVSRVMLEYIGRSASERPDLLAELAGLLMKPQEQLVAAVVPHVIGWLCLNEKQEGLKVR